MKSNKLIKILGIVRGWKLLPGHVQELTRNCEASPDTLDQDEKVQLSRFVRDLGLDYTSFYSNDMSHYLAQNANGTGVMWVDALDDFSLWTRSWYNAYENKATGNRLRK